MVGVPVGFNLGDLVLRTANELREAQAKANKDDPVLQFTGCEIELAVTATAEAGGGIKFWLVDASVKASRENVSTVKINFGPVPGKKALQYLQETGGAAPKNPKRKVRS